MGAFTQVICWFKKFLLSPIFTNPLLKTKLFFLNKLQSPYPYYKVNKRTFRESIFILFIYDCFIQTSSNLFPIKRHPLFEAPFVYLFRLMNIESRFLYSLLYLAMYKLCIMNIIKHDSGPIIILRA